MALTKTKAFTNAKPIPLPNDANPKWIAVDVEYSSAAYAVNDIIAACTLPIGHKVLDWLFLPADADSNASPVLAFSLGVALATLADLSAEVWGTGVLSGTTAITRNGTNIAAQGDTTTERVVALKCTTAAATYAGSGKTGQLMLLVQA